MLVSELKAYRDISKVMYISKNSFKLRIYNQSFKVKRKGLEELQNCTLNTNFSLGVVKKSVKEFKLKSLRLDNLYRTKRSITDLICENFDSFKTFITLTFSAEVKCPKIAYNYYKKFYDSWYKFYKKLNLELKILGVIEIQKNGRIHYHLLSNLRLDFDIEKRKSKLVRSKGKSQWINYYNIRFWSYGFSLAKKIDLENEKHLCNYFLKYLLKDLDDKFFYNHKYISTRNLLRTRKYYIDDVFSYDDLYNYYSNLIDKLFIPYNNYSYSVDSFNSTLVFNEYQYLKVQNNVSDNSFIIDKLESRLKVLSKAVRLT